MSQNENFFSAGWGGEVKRRDQMARPDDEEEDVVAGAVQRRQGEQGGEEVGGRHEPVRPLRLVPAAEPRPADGPRPGCRTAVCLQRMGAHVICDFLWLSYELVCLFIYLFSY